MRSEHRGGGEACLLSLILVVLIVVPATYAETLEPATVTIEMSEFAFAPSVIRIPRGRPLNLIFVNRGQIAHQFEAPYLRTVHARLVTDTLYAEVNGLQILRLQPATRAKLQFIPRQAGRFQFACTIEGHREAGMTGILEVR